MRKWTYLVAALLMAGTTATFTGCIDTDEPEGISNLRGAKAELIKADAAFRLVEAEWQKAKVAEQELINKAKELDLEYKKYDNEMHALDVKLKELEVERAQASTEQQRAECDKKIAEANRDKAAAENAMALAAEKFKADMLAYQQTTAIAQEAYDNAMKLIEASKLLLTDGEKAIITKAQSYLFVAAADLNVKYKDLKDAQTKFNAALTDKDTPTLASLEAALSIAKVKVEKDEIILKERNRLLDLANDFNGVQWDKEIANLETKIQKAKISRDSATVKKEAIERSEAYKAAQAKKDETAQALIDAKAAYAKAQTDSTDQTNEQRAILGVEKDPINPALVKLFSQAKEFTNLTGYDKTTGVFSYTNAVYTQAAYDADLEREEVLRTNQAAMRLRTVDGWISALGYTVDENGVEWEKIELPKRETAATEAKKAFDTQKTIWDISVKAVKGTATAVPTTNIKKATDAYNTAYTALTAAVTGYNKAYDDVYQVAYDKYIEKTKAAKLDAFYRDRMISALLPADKIIWDALPAADQTTARLEIILNEATKQAKAKTDSNNDLDAYYKIAGNQTNLVDAAKAAGTLALGADTDKKIANALEALKTANTNVTKAIDEISKAGGAIAIYKALAANPYGQVVSKNVTVKDMTGEGAFFENEVVNNVATGHKKALRSDISADEFSDLTTTKLDETVAKNALDKQSGEAFGNKISPQNRLLDVTEDMVRTHAKANGLTIDKSNYGLLGAKIVADDALQLCKDMIAAAGLIEKLRTDIDKMRVTLIAEIDANTAKMIPFIDAANIAKLAVKTAEVADNQALADRDALTAPTQAAIDKFNALVTDLEAIKTTLENQFNDITGAGNMTAEEYVNYWKDQVAQGEKAVETAKQAVISAEKTIELFKKGEYTQAYVVEQARILMETASNAYNAAKTVYDSALAQVQKVLDTLIN